MKKTTNKNQLDPWDKVTSSVRSVLKDDERDTDAPFGFSTRVVSAWVRERRQQALAIWNRWSWHGAVCSVLLMLAAVAYGLIQSRSIPLAEDVLFSIPAVEVPTPSELGS